MGKIFRAYFLGHDQFWTKQMLFFRLSPEGHETWQSVASYFLGNILSGGWKWGIQKYLLRSRQVKNSTNVLKDYFFLLLNVFVGTWRVTIVEHIEKSGRVYLRNPDGVDAAEEHDEVWYLAQRGQRAWKLLHSYWRRVNILRIIFHLAARILFLFFFCCIIYVIFHCSLCYLSANMFTEHWPWWEVTETLS